MLTRIDRMMLFVNSQDEAKKFWTEKMGFVVTIEQEMEDNPTWIEVAPAGGESASLILIPRWSAEEQDRPTPHPSIIFKSDSAPATRTQLKERGVEVGDIQHFPWGDMFGFQDNDGQSYTVLG